VLAQEIHHRVKNNLQTVASLLRLQSRAEGVDPREALEHSVNRILAIAAVHEVLTEQRDEDVELADLIDRLRASIVQGLGAGVMSRRRSSRCRSPAAAPRHSPSSSASCSRTRSSTEPVRCGSSLRSGTATSCSRSPTRGKARAMRQRGRGSPSCARSCETSCSAASIWPAAAPRSSFRHEPARRQVSAPAYKGEGAHALWHVSEDPAITRFEPRDGRVWAIDTRHCRSTGFPRDCPRATFWAVDDTTDDDVDRFLGGDRTRRVHVIEPAWLDRMRSARLHVYRLPDATFEPEDRYWISSAAVEPLGCAELGDLIGLHAAAEIELRIAPGLLELWERVTASTLDFSGIRLRNATLAR